MSDHILIGKEQFGRARGNVIELFLFKAYERGKYASLYVLSRPFKYNAMLEGKARSLSLRGTPVNQPYLQTPGWAGKACYGQTL